MAGCLLADHVAEGSMGPVSVGCLYITYNNTSRLPACSYVYIVYIIPAAHIKFQCLSSTFQVFCMIRSCILTFSMFIKLLFKWILK